MKSPFYGVAAALLLTAGAQAGELVTTADAASPPPQLAASGAAPPLDQRFRPAAADDPRQTPSPETGCREAAERDPHGEVTAGVGTRGYRNVGAAVTAPVGKCATLSIAVSRTQSAFGPVR